MSPEGFEIPAQKPGGHPKACVTSAQVKGREGGRNTSSERGGLLFSSYLSGAGGNGWRWVSCSLRAAPRARFGRGRQSQPPRSGASRPVASAWLWAQPAAEELKAVSGIAVIRPLEI